MRPIIIGATIGFGLTTVCVALPFLISPGMEADVGFNHFYFSHVGFICFWSVVIGLIVGVPLGVVAGLVGILCRLIHQKGNEPLWSSRKSDYDRSGPDTPQAE